MGSISGGFDGSLSANVQDNADMNFGNFTTNSYVYMGGLPSWYTTKLSSLALPSVVFEPRFRGGIRNVVFADDSSGRPRRQEIMAYKVSANSFSFLFINNSIKKRRARNGSKLSYCIKNVFLVFEVVSVSNVVLFVMLAVLSK